MPTTTKHATIKKSALTEAVGKIQRHMDLETNLRIHGTTLEVRGSGDTLELTSQLARTNHAIHAEMDAPGVGTGSLHLRIEDIKPVLAGLSNSAEVAVSEGEIRLGKVTLEGQKPSDDQAEKWPNVADGGSFAVLGTEHVADIPHVCGMAATDDHRPVLTDVCIGEHDGAPVMVSTDSYRLAMSPLYAMERRGDHKLSLPAKVLNEARQAVGSVGIDWDDTSEPSQPEAYPYRLTYETKHANYTVTGTQIVGQYPNWDQLIPEPNAFTGQFVWAEDAVASAKQLAKLPNRNAPVRLSPNGGTIQASLTGPDCPKARVDGIATGEVPEGFEIGANPDFLLDALEWLPSATTHVTTPLRPMLFVDGRRKVLLMPIRLNT